MTTAIQVLHEHGKENQFKDSQAKLVKVHKINKISISMESCQMKNRYGECTHGSDVNNLLLAVTIIKTVVRLSSRSYVVLL